MNTATTVDMWYDTHTRSWVVQSKDAAGNQVGDADYIASRDSALRLKAQRERDIVATLATGVSETTARHSHTPGPWRLLKVRTKLRGIDVYSERPDQHVASVPVPQYVPDGQRTAEANAQLIAAAPALLAACESVAEAMRGGDYEVAFKAVHAAIVAARGFA